MKTNKQEQLITNIREGRYDERLRFLYPDGSPVQTHRERYCQAISNFVSHFGNRVVELYSSPGRTEICGNHCDHQNGRVIAACVSTDILAVISRRKDSVVRVYSEGYAPVSVDLSDTRANPEEAGTMAALIRGMAAERKAKASEEALPGFDAYLTSRIPSGSGMSSSAAFEMLLEAIFSGRQPSDYPLSKEEVIQAARMGQRTENRYFGKPSGLMDQLTCAAGGMLFMDFQQTDAPEMEPLHADLAGQGYQICLVNTGGSHADLTEDYASIPRDMKKIAACFSKQVLRDVPLAQFLDAIPKLREQAGDRAVLRALHFFEENERVVRAKEELLKDSTDGIQNFIEIVKASGRSSFQLLQNIIPESHPEKQSLALALAISDRFLTQEGASRVHGGGFAGTIQAFVPAHLIQSYRETMESVFGPGSVMILPVRPVGPFRLV